MQICKRRNTEKRDKMGARKDIRRKMNAELYSFKENERATIEAWLIQNKIEYDDRLSTEELIEIYRKVEIGKK